MNSNAATAQNAFIVHCMLSIYVRFDVLQADIDGLGQRHNENKQI